MKFLTIAKTLARYWRMAHDPRTPAAVRYLIYAGIVFTVSPVRLLPKWVPGFGLLDDEEIVPLLIAASMMLIPKQVKEEHDDEERVEIADNQIEGKIEADKAEQKALTGKPVAA